MNWNPAQYWPLFAVLVLIVLAGMAWRRQRDRIWIDRYFSGRKPLAISYGVIFFGLSSDPGQIRHHSGFLALFPDRLFHRTPRTDSNTDIPIDRIVKVHHGRFSPW